MKISREKLYDLQVFKAKIVEKGKHISSRGCLSVMCKTEHDDLIITNGKNCIRL